MTPAQYERVREIFLAARDLGGERRSSFLRHSCSDDAAMRTEVESLARAPMQQEDDRNVSGSFVAIDHANRVTERSVGADRGHFDRTIGWLNGRRLRGTRVANQMGCRKQDQPRGEDEGETTLHPTS